MYCFYFELEKWQIDSIKSIIDLVENGLQRHDVPCKITKHPSNEAFILSGGIVPTKSCEIEFNSIMGKML